MTTTTSPRFLRADELIARATVTRLRSYGAPTDQLAAAEARLARLQAQLPR